MPEMLKRAANSVFYEVLMLGLSAIAQRVFGSANDRKLKPMWATVAEINALEDSFKAKSDGELKAMTAPPVVVNKGCFGLVTTTCGNDTLRESSARHPRHV